MESVYKKYGNSEQEKCFEKYSNKRCLPVRDVLKCVYASGRLPEHWAEMVRHFAAMVMR